MSIENNLTLTEFKQEFFMQEQEVHKLNYADLSEEDKDLLAEFAEKQEFLKETENALDFAQRSTALLVRDGKDGQEFSLETMTSKEEYAKEILTLTNGLDNEFIALVQRDKDKFDRFEQNAQMETVLNEPVMKEEIELQMQERESEEITIEEVKEMQEQIRQERERQELQKEEDKPDRTAERFAELADAALLTVLAVEVAQELTKETEELERNKPVEIVEGNDGILNVSKAEEIAPDKTEEVKEVIKEKTDEVERAFEKGDKGNREDSERSRNEKEEKRTEEKSNDEVKKQPKRNSRNKSDRGR